MRPFLLSLVLLLVVGVANAEPLHIQRHGNPTHPGVQQPQPNPGHHRYYPHYRPHPYVYPPIYVHPYQFTYPYYGGYNYYPYNPYYYNFRLYIR